MFEVLSFQVWHPSAVIFWHTTTEQLGSILKTTSTDIINLLFLFWEPAAEAEGGLEAGHVGTDDVYRKVVPVLKCMVLLVSSEGSHSLAWPKVCIMHQALGQLHVNRH
jgi:hypothetical protein